MKITNIYNLPSPLVLASESDYPPQRGRFSVTDLINPPRMRILKMLYWDEIEDDVSNRLWKILGTAVHDYLARFGEVTEIKIEETINGATVVGKFDYYTPEKIMVDWKCISYYAIKLGSKPEWEQQLNLYAYLASQGHGLEIRGLKTWAILVRDYDRRKAIPPEYPPSPFMEIEHPLWSLETQKIFLEERLKLHQQAEKNIKQGRKKVIPQCTPEEMWQKPETYAVKTPDRKTAWRVLNDYEEAKKWAEENMPNYRWGETAKRVFIEVRPGEKTRCEHYCLVAKICQQIKTKKEDEHS